MAAFEEDVAWDYVAVRAGQSRFRTSVAVVSMGTVICDVCGAQFVLSHGKPVVDANLASRQAAWLEARLANDHQNGVPHEDAVPLPSTGI
jgi:hypothetical protein